MLEKLIGPEIRELIEREDLATLAECLNGWLPADLADLVADLRHREQALFLKSLRPALAASTFEYLDLPTQERLLGSLSAADAATILNDMAPDDRTAFLEELPEELSGGCSPCSTPSSVPSPRTSCAYEEDSVGRLMTPDYRRGPGGTGPSGTCSITSGRTARTARRSTSSTSSMTGNKLIDDLRIREILLAPLARQRPRHHGRPVRRPEGDGRQGVGGRGLPEVRPHGPARRRPGGHARSGS